MKKLMMYAGLFLLIIASNSFALIGLRVGANANITQPSATIAFEQLTNESFNPTGFGVTAFAMADLMLLKITADVGYIDFGEQSYEWTAPIDFPTTMKKVSAQAKVTAIPILVGLRWEVGLPVGPKFHFGFQAGVHNFTYTYEGTAIETIFVDETQTSTEFSIAPIIGLRWSALEASLLYMVVEDFNYVGLRLGYTFGFGI
ncbi:hypothetical protein JXA02_04175 [candidate division KSB1 bacterium]|nr:hypothetical protein [candidate division KSB1 bacterium]RQW09080.1 MAG: hypothetical protein EH222_04685 [candidate division KSB1 bacterium]